MSFYNKKEEVIDLQLTQFGKYMLSKGKFMPAFYAFSDDEILYSNEYVSSGKKEKSKETSERIQKETQRLKTLYAYEGIETRILKLNGHEIRDFGSSWRARRTARFEEMPAGNLYGVDYVNEEMMHSEQRDVIRNMLGHSTVGEKTSPSWEIDSLRNGTITSVNISSSTPNVGIKRPVLNVEIEEELRVRDRNPNIGLGGYIDASELMTIGQYNAQTGLERIMHFVDNRVMTAQDASLVLSVVEQNVDYSKENFELEFYVLEDEENLPNNQTQPSQRRLYFSDQAGNNQDIDKRFVNYYFEFLKDQDMADLYGVDIFGTQRNKLKNLVRDTIADQDSRNLDPRTGQPIMEEEMEGDSLPDLRDPCDEGEEV